MERRKRGPRSSPVVVERSFLRDIPVYDMVGEERLEPIHEASMQILEEVGIEFRDSTALAAWREAGAGVAQSRVRIPRALLMQKVALAPSSYRFRGRNPDRSIDVGGNSMAFAPVYGSPYVRTLEGERRYARLAEFTDFVKLAYLSPA
jgi:trimethylamine--corrinoid protein Co-methyltransferase